MGSKKTNKRILQELKEFINGVEEDCKESQRRNAATDSTNGKLNLIFMIKHIMEKGGKEN